MAGDRKDVHVYEADCNRVLLDSVFPRVKWADYRRALYLLDPYALNLRWEVLHAAGQGKSIEIFLNFMVMDINMNVLKHDPSKVRADQVDRMNAFWGDETWRQAGYSTEPGLFSTVESKTSNEDLAEAFRERLQKVAGFTYVPKPVPMRNRNGAIVYYLFFASPNRTGAKIVGEIFDTYRDRRA